MKQVALSFFVCTLLAVPIDAAPPSGNVVTQLPEKADSQLRADFSEKPKSQKSKPKWENFSAGPVPQWIWGQNHDSNYRLKTTFSGNIASVQLRASCDNVMTLFLNGKKLISSTEWQEAVSVNLSSKIKPGQNELIAEVSNQGGVAAFVLKLVLTDSAGKKSYVITDENWQIVDKQDAPTQEKIKIIGKLGDGPWNNVFDIIPDENGVPRDTFVLLPGFEVEKLFTVPKETFGSWVSIAFDSKGRLLASDQGDKGIYRITPPKIGSDEATKVERLDLKLSSAQGMLYAFDSLYLSINGGPGSGLYRARDTNGDDQYDELIKLKAFEGGGEHGPHALRLSPDGKSIYVICGNHTNPPFKAGEDKQNPDYSSRIPTNWSEDLLLPRQWDANGHARGKLAPGGWIAKTDPEGKTWEVFSVGYRNPYDMDFNRHGDLFAYDADMEWDIGTPWYRPTRVVHASSGSEFGWRSGTGKWLPNYPDSLPQLVDIGPGSPVGAGFGYGTDFPQKYEQAFYICDWTFGTMYAIHIEPDGSGYKAVKEEFLSRSPLPLTDVAVGNDGALYFTSGGRGTQSELFRVIYTGKQKKSRKNLSANSKESKLRKERHQIEKLHQDGLKLSSKQLWTLVDQLGHQDRFLRYTARIALEDQATDLWAGSVLKQKNPVGVINGVIGLARQADPALQPRLIAALESINFNSLDISTKLDLVRAWQLVFTRMGTPDEATSKRLASKYDPYFPATSTKSKSKPVEWA
ncbi:MAG: heme-binding protein, partial [Planctomycetaceae bacterium]|nr:heme-binding protein [Planctomycetaceae bacterium]